MSGRAESEPDPADPAGVRIAELERQIAALTEENEALRLARWRAGMLAPPPDDHQGEEIGCGMSDKVMRA